MIDERVRAGVVAAGTEPASNVTLDRVLRFLRVDKSRGLALANLGFVVGMAVDGVINVFFYDAWALVLIVPFVAFYYITARQLSKGETMSLGWMRASGYVSLFLAAMCAWAFVDSVTMTPVDYGCAIASVVYAVGLGWLGAIELRRAGLGIHI